MSEQRRERRAPALLRVKYKSTSVEQFVEQFGTDISRGGIFIRTKKPLKLGAPLKLELQLKDASSVIHGVGRVTWRREPGTVSRDCAGRLEQPGVRRVRSTSTGGASAVRCWIGSICGFESLGSIRTSWPVHQPSRVLPCGSG